jgi:transglutaminase-like putative cysteine protease
MRDPSGTDRDRRVIEFGVALTCLLALGLLAAVFAGGGSALVTATDEETPAPAELAGEVDGAGLVGGGSLGAAERNPVGVGVTNETNPFRTRSGTLQFVVSGERPSYWRVDAYDEYDNGTWVRTGPYEPYEGRIEPTGRVTAESNYTVTLEREAIALPAAWQPATVTTANASELAVSAETGLHMPTRAAASKQYTVTRYHYTPETRRLLTARAMYPPSIEAQYTAVPNGTADRVRTLSNNITADAITPVQAACHTETWIETNTEYDLEATHDPGEDPVEQFLFEMEAGNAEYAASSMVVLLRAQGVPARYVTGYTPGEPLGPSADAEAETGTGTNSYGVRAVNAHAWVEVYVSGYGWIPFDPVPSADRLAVENEADGVERAMVDASLPTNCSVSVDIEPLPETGTQNITIEDSTTEQSAAETEGADTTADAEADADEDADAEASEAALNATFGSSNVTVLTDRTPLVIGGTATVELLSDGEPVANGTVTIDGQSVGTTDPEGRLEFVVPATLSAGRVPLTVRTDTVDGGQLVSVAEFRLVAESDRVLAVPGETVAVQALVGERPVEGVEIRQDGSVVATTDANGTAQVPLSAAPETTVSASYVGRQATTRIENRLLGTALRALGVLGIIVGLGVVLAREYNLGAALRRGKQGGIAALRRGGAGGWHRLRRLPALLRTARQRGLWASLKAVARWPITLLHRMRERLPASVIGYLLVLGLQLYRSLTGQRTDRDASAASTDAGVTGSDAASVDPSEAGTEMGRSIRRVWVTFVRLALRRLNPTSTPGEIARKAIARGFPRGPVVRLTNAFRAAAYGPEPSERHVEEATTALETIERTAGEVDDESTEADRTGAPTDR